MLAEEYIRGEIDRKAKGLAEREQQVATLRAELDELYDALDGVLTGRAKRFRGETDA